MKPDAEFVKDFEASHESVLRIGRVLADTGYNVVMPIPALRGNSSERMAFADCGDILLLQAVQIKHRSISFTSAKDFPYPTIIVDEKYKVDDFGRNLAGYVMENASCTHIAIIDARTTRTRWVIEKIWDDAQQRECENYCCPVELAIFKELG